jgi:hypothetical protein
MNIKSLLLGSAAALIAVSGARAADAVVVAEPEPAEYVKICDVYGAGYFYIPGTETCLKIGGYMRYDIGVGDISGMKSIDKKDLFDTGNTNINDTYYKNARFDLQLDVRSETEYGTLQGVAELRFNYGTNSNGISLAGLNVPQSVIGFPISDSAYSWDLNQSYIKLGGLVIGKRDSLFTTWTNYVGNIIQDTLIGYGPFGTNQIAYEFDSGPFSAAISLEEGDGDLVIPGSGGLVMINAYTIDSYMPHVVGGVAYDAGMFKLSAVAAYDSVWEEWAAKARLDVKASDTISGFVMAGFGSHDKSYGAFGSPNYYAKWGGDWAVWAGLSAQVSEKAQINALLGYDDAKTFEAVANVAYSVAPGFTVTPEVQYTNTSGSGDAWGAVLRFQRSF